MKLNHKRFATFALALALLGLLVVVSIAQAVGPETHSKADVVTLPGLEVVGHSNLVRQSGKVIMEYKGDSLIPGHAYTLWWLIGIPPFSLDEGEAVLNAEGFVADKSQVNLNLKLDVGTMAMPGGLCCFGTFTEDLAAGRIQAIMLDHGDSSLMSPEELEMALSNPHFGLEDGCSNMGPPEGTPCPGVLNTIHPAPTP